MTSEEGISFLSPHTRLFSIICVLGFISLSHVYSEPEDGLRAEVSSGHSLQVERVVRDDVKLECLDKALQTGDQQKVVAVWGRVNENDHTVKLRLPTSANVDASSNLIISNISVHDGGLYTCSIFNAQNSALITQTRILLTVQVPPSFIKRPQPSTRLAPQTARFGTYHPRFALA